MDYTETPHAEDFATELDDLIQAYRKRGLKAKHVAQILKDFVEDL